MLGILNGWLAYNGALESFPIIQSPLVFYDEIVDVYVDTICNVFFKCFFLVLYNSDLILGELFFFDNLLPTFRDLHLYICMISLDTDGQWEPWLLYFRRRSWMSIVTNGLAWCRRWSCIDPRPRWQWWPVVWRLMTGLIGSMFTHCFIMLHYGLLMSWMFKISYSLMPTHTYIYNYRYTYVYINTYIIRYITFRSSLYLSCHRRSLLVGEQLGLCTWPHVLTLLPGAGGTSAVPMLGSTLGMVIIPPMKIVMHGGIVYVFFTQIISNIIWHTGNL